MENETIAHIDASRNRLRQFIDTTSEDELSQPIEGDWTGAAFLAHLAFWDRRVASVLRRFQQGDLTPSPVDIDIINDAAIHQWRLIPPRAAAQEALAAAEDVDAIVKSLSPDLISAMRDAQIDLRYNRSGHRNAHLDQFERALGRN